MDWSCNKCGGEGRISICDHDPTRPQYVICSNCQKPSAYVWCDKCGMGGQIAETDFSVLPSRWTCVDCGMEYDLPAGFYQEPVMFQPKAFSDFVRAPRSVITIPWIKSLFRLWKRLSMYLTLLALLGIMTGAILEAERSKNLFIIPSPVAYGMMFAGLAILAIVLTGNIFKEILSAYFAILYRINHRREYLENKMYFVFSRKTAPGIILFEGFTVFFALFFLLHPLLLKFSLNPSTVLGLGIFIEFFAAIISPSIADSRNLKRFFLGGAVSALVSLGLAVLMAAL